jgi:hypothetical protein
MQRLDSVYWYQNMTMNAKYGFVGKPLLTAETGNTDYVK